MCEPEYIQHSFESKAEYFALEAKSAIKHEFWWGEMVATAGAMRNHVTVAANAFRAIDNRLDNTPCQAVKP